MTFYATARTGKLTVKTLRSFDPLVHVKPSDVSTQRDRQGNMVTNFCLPRTKSAQTGEDISWAKQFGPSDPHAALENHMSVNAPPPNGALFAYRHGRSHVALTRSKFLSLLASALKASGNPPWSTSFVTFPSTSSRSKAGGRATLSSYTSAVTPKSSRLTSRPNLPYTTLSSD